MIYYACATDYSLLVFGGATFCSYLTIGMVKQVAWIIALRHVATRLKSEGFGALGTVTRDLDDFSKYTLSFIGALGAVLIAYKLFVIVMHCKQPPPPAEDLEGKGEKEKRGGGRDGQDHSNSNPAFSSSMGSTYEVEGNKSERAVNLPPRLVSTSSSTGGFGLSDDARVNDAVLAAFEKFDDDNSGTLTKAETMHFIAEQVRSHPWPGMPGPNMRIELTPLARSPGTDRLQQLDVTEQYVQGVWSVYDANGNGTLELAEFARMWEVLLGLSDDARVKDAVLAAFEKYDDDNSGTLTKAETMHFIAEQVCPHPWSGMPGPNELS